MLLLRLFVQWLVNRVDMPSLRGRTLSGFEKAFPAPDTFDSVAVMAQQLKVLNLVRAALRSRNDVVKPQVLPEVLIAASLADTLLFLIEGSPRIEGNSYVTRV